MEGSWCRSYIIISRSNAKLTMQRLGHSKSPLSSGKSGRLSIWVTTESCQKKKKKRLGLREMERRRDFLLYCCWVSDYNSQDQSGIKITPKIGRGKKDVRGRKWTLWECLGRQFLRIPDPVLIQVHAELDTSALPQFRYYHHLLKAVWLGKWWLFKPSLSSLIFSNCLLHVSSM